MNIAQIKTAVDLGMTVCWKSAGYQVLKDSSGQYNITFIPNDNCVGLTNKAGDRLNGAESEFFIHKGHLTLDTFVDMYLDWVNNFVTCAAFAEHYGIDHETASFIISTGLEINNLIIKGRTDDL